MSAPGRLILLPMPLDPAQSPLEILPPATRAYFAELELFVVENARTARRFLAPLLNGRPVQAIELIEWSPNRRQVELDAVMARLATGNDIGLLSDAGCPAVADPGADLVAAAHRLGARVIPAIGPSALLLALMASGMGGQRFAFVGYLPTDSAERNARLRELEQRSAAADETILFIETPYRNPAMLAAAIDCLAPTTVLMTASGLSLASEKIVSRSVAAWRDAGDAADAAVERRVPAMFALKASSRASAARTRDSAQPRSRPRPQGGLKPGRKLRSHLAGKTLRD